ncbi:MAG: hypothetical protein QI197_04645 [Candidatus Korarchaeota archaeon]|nr:hypothetical protein [Candidatus Korarchaeota archaeon]
MGKGILGSIGWVFTTLLVMIIILAPAMILYYLHLPSSLSPNSIYVKAFQMDVTESERIRAALNEPMCRTVFGSHVGIDIGSCWMNLAGSYYMGAFLVPALLILLSGTESAVRRWTSGGVLTHAANEVGKILFSILLITFLFYTAIHSGVLGCLYVAPVVIVPLHRLYAKGRSHSLLLILMVSYYLLMLLFRISVIGGFSGKSIELCFEKLLYLDFMGFLGCIFNYKSRSTFWFINHLETAFGISFLLTAFPLIVFLTSPGRFVMRSRKSPTKFIGRMKNNTESFIKFWYLIFRQVIARSKGYVIIPFIIGLMLSIFVTILPFIRFWLHPSSCLNLDSLSDLYQDVDVAIGSFLLWGIPMAGLAVTPEELINNSIGITLRRILIKNPRKIAIIGSGRLVKSLLHNLRDKYGFMNAETVLFEDEMLKVHRTLVLIDYDEFVAHKRYDDEVFGKIGIYIMKNTAIICLLGERESQSPDFKLKDSKEKLHVLNKFTELFEAIVIASRSPRVQNGLYKMLRGEYFRGKYNVLLISVEQNSQLKVLFSGGVPQ